MENPTHFIILPEDAGKRLDVFLHEKFPEHSRSLLAKAITQKNVLINQKPKKPSYSLKINDVITFLPEFYSPHPSSLIPHPSLSLPILFEDENVLVIDKPAGIQVHPSATEKENTVANWLIAYLPKIATVGEDTMRPGIVHRLDKDTSGVLVIAKNQLSFEELKKLFAERKIQKEYLAFVYGIPSPESGIINKPIARSASFRKQVIPEGRTKFKGTPREAITEYELVRQEIQATSDKRQVTDDGQQAIVNRQQATDSECPLFLVAYPLSLVRVRPHTGRMHQIRIHLASIGHPIVGDKLYFKKEFKNFPTSKRQLLHAHTITFPLFDKDYTFTAPIPKDFTKFISNKGR